VEAAAARPGDDHWRWRLRMVQKIAAELDPERYGVKGLYLYGSTKNATAGPGSDIDVLVHFAGPRRSTVNSSAGWRGGASPSPR